jgi:hypothetical protein
MENQLNLLDNDLSPISFAAIMSCMLILAVLVGQLIDRFLTKVL